MKLIKKKYELKDEESAKAFIKEVKALKYNAVILGSAVIAEVRETIKMKALEDKYSSFTFFLSKFDMMSLEKEKSQKKKAVSV